MEIYAPLAERLGIWQIKWELEDLAFKALDPERYRELARQLDTRRASRETLHRAGDRRSSPGARAHGIEADLNGRPKHLYSIWKKMQRKAAAFSEIYDVYAIRILVDEVRDCYAALGVVHCLWRPIPGQFDDYIAVPKPNGYQSLHTAVIALDGKPLEIQIRTHAMHQVTEVGIAAHWRYKEGSQAEREYDAKLAWLRQLMDWQREVSDATGVRRGHQARHLPGPGLRLHPEGRHEGPAGRRDPARLRLPDPHRRRPPLHRRQGQQPPRAPRLPAAERRHRRDRDHEGASTARRATGWPSSGPRHAREKIRQWFKRKDRDENITHGREALERELRRLARTTIPASGTSGSPRWRAPPATTVDDFYAAIGYGALSAQQVVIRLGVVDDAQLALPAVAPPRPATGGVRVKGVGDLLVRFAKCCHPIPGDPIVGFITRGKGITVHLGPCPTVVNEREVSRLIEVEWEAAPPQTYPIAIRVEAYDRTGLLNDITGIVAENKVNIVAANVAVTQDHTATVAATLQVASVGQLARVMSRIEQLKDVSPSSATWAEGDRQGERSRGDHRESLQALAGRAARSDRSGDTIVFKTQQFDKYRATCTPRGLV